MAPFLSFFFNDTATTEIYTLSLHDALPIFGNAEGSYYNPRHSWVSPEVVGPVPARRRCVSARCPFLSGSDRKSTRLNSSHANISYAVFCLKKKKQTPYIGRTHVLTLVNPIS